MNISLAALALVAGAVAMYRAIARDDDSRKSLRQEQAA